MIDKIEMVEVKKLKPHPLNANKHPKDQVERLAKIIEYQGFRYPVKVSKQTGFITSGHGRVDAAKLKGWTHVPVSYQDYETSDQEKADVHADNAIASWSEIDLSSVNDQLKDFDPSFDIDLLGIKNFTIDVAEKQGLTDEDEVPEKVDTICKPGDIWLLGEHRLMCGDSTDIQEVEKLMSGKAADLIFTDPPYGLDGKNYFNDYHYDYDDAKAFDLTKLNFDSDFVIWGANYYDYLPEPRSKIGWVVWDKRPTRETWDEETRERADRRFGQHFEIAVTNVKNMRGKMLRKTWGGFYGTAGNKDDTIVHKTQKPISLIEPFLCENHFLVLDYFLGSGSTLIACEKNGRKCFGLEIMPEYCDVIIKRWENYTGKKATRHE